MRPDCAAGGFQSQSHDVSRKPGNNSNRRSGGPPGADKRQICGARFECRAGGGEVTGGSVGVREKKNLKSKQNRRRRAESKLSVCDPSRVSAAVRLKPPA